MDFCNFTSANRSYDIHKIHIANRQTCIRYVCVHEKGTHRKTITNFISENVFVIIQIKCIFNLDAHFFLSTLCSIEKKNIKLGKKPSWWFCIAKLSICACANVCVFVLSVEAAVQLIFILNFRADGDGQQAKKTTKQEKNCSTCPPKYPRYMRNCYCVALKNLLLSLGFCTYLQLISISIYFSFFFSLSTNVCVFVFLCPVCNVQRPK